MSECFVDPMVNRENPRSFLPIFPCFQGGFISFCVVCLYACEFECCCFFWSVCEFFLCFFSTTLIDIHRFSPHVFSTHPLIKRITCRCNFARGSCYLMTFQCDMCSEVTFFFNLDFFEIFFV